MLEGIRELDKLGRIVLPSEIRKKLSLKPKEQLYISYNGSEIVIKKQHNTCVFCKGEKVLEKFHGKYICQSCRNQLNQNAKL